MGLPKKLLCILLALAACLSALPAAALAAEEAETIPAEEAVVAPEEESPATDGATGWVKSGSDWLYYNSDGTQLKSGWLKSGGSWYYFVDGVMLANTTRKVDGETYRFGSSGAMITGWYKTGGNWYYYNSYGAMKENGWLKSGGSWYYFVDGVMLADTTRVIDGDSYRFGSSGAMVTGWYRTGGNWYYYSSYGAVEKGWKYIGSSWYYFKDSVMQTGWLELSDGTYYLGTSGAMTTGWLKHGGEWYYFNSAGRMQTGWVFLDNWWYYFYKKSDSGVTGAMAHDTTVDGYTIKSGGEAVTAAEIYMKRAAQSYSSATNYLMLVDTTKCKVGVFTGSDYNWSLLKYWNCSPGAPESPTVTGVFTVASKGYYFDSGEARCYYYTQFYGAYLFHSVLYYHDGTLMDGRLGMHLSHGCVRLAYNNAYWVYNNIPKGTKVVVY